MPRSGSQGDDSRDKAREALSQIYENHHRSPTSPAIATIEDGINDLWERLRNDKYYVMTHDEFTLFDCFRAHYNTSQNKQIALRARELYWQNAKGGSKSKPKPLERPEPLDLGLESPTGSLQVSIPPSPEIHSSTLLDVYNDVIDVADSLLADNSFIAGREAWAVSINRFLLGIKLWGNAIGAGEGILGDITKDLEVSMLVLDTLQACARNLNELRRVSQDSINGDLNDQRIEDNLHALAGSLTELEATVMLFEAFANDYHKSSVLHNLSLAISRQIPSSSHEPSSGEIMTRHSSITIDGMLRVHAHMHAQAKDIQGVVSRCLAFQDSLPPKKTAKIASLVTELLGVKTALLDFCIEYMDPRNRAHAVALSKKQHVISKSLDYTIQAFHGLLNSATIPELRSGVLSIALNDYLTSGSGDSLDAPLGDYKAFLIELTGVVTGGHPTPRFELLFVHLAQLLQAQDGSVTVPSLEQPSPRHMSKAPAPKARRAALDWDAFYGHSKRSISSSYAGSMELRSASDAGRSSGPKASTSKSVLLGATPSSSTQSPSTLSNRVDHWLTVVWSKNPAATPLSAVPQERSICFGEHTSGTSHKLQEEFVKLISLPFDRLEVCIYLRELDRKAQVYCCWEKVGTKIESVKPVRELQIFRKGSVLRLLHKPDLQQQRSVWANLDFTTYERLVLFHCSFLALRAQGGYLVGLDDRILYGESKLFTRQIRMHGSSDFGTHSLQILRDDDSGGIRLMASPFHGFRKHVPVWVVFIDAEIKASKVIKQGKKVLLSGLERYIFTRDDKLQETPKGGIELEFLSDDDATSFVETIEAIQRGKLSGKDSTSKQ